jgi:hypothetical protein
LLGCLEGLCSLLAGLVVFIVTSLEEEEKQINQFFKRTMRCIRQACTPTTPARLSQGTNLRHNCSFAVVHQTAAPHILTLSLPPCLARLFSLFTICLCSWCACCCRSMVILLTCVLPPG